MLTVEQVKNLDEKVRMALDLIESQRSENSMLKAKLDEYKQRVEQLESVVDGFKLEQLEIEEGIKDVLTQLDQLEDQITDPSPAAPIAIASTDAVQAVVEEASAPIVEQSSVEQAVSEPPVIEQPQKAEEEVEPPTVETPELEIF